jgi:hypothetical protein
MSHTWYVTGEVRPGVLPRPRHPRLSSTFETEAEAKDFARAKPVLSQDIPAWVADEGKS